MLDPLRAGYMWKSSTLPSNTYGYQTNPNNLSARGILLHTAPVYGVQKNMSQTVNGCGIITAGGSTAPSGKWVPLICN
ncbi:collagen alpha-1(XVII) chain-like [Arapaima gigas]